MSAVPSVTLKNSAGFDNFLKFLDFYWTLNCDQKSSVLSGWCSSGWPVPCLMGGRQLRAWRVRPWADWGFKLMSSRAYCVFVNWRALPVKCDKTETNSKYTYSLWTYEIYTVHTPFQHMMMSKICIQLGDSYNPCCCYNIHQILFFKYLKICI